MLPLDRRSSCIDRVRRKRHLKKMLPQSLPVCDHTTVASKIRIHHLDGNLWAKADEVRSPGLERLMEISNQNVNCLGFKSIDRDDPAMCSTGRPTAENLRKHSHLLHHGRDQTGRV